MFRLLIQVFDRLLLGSCFASLSLVFLSIAALLRQLPRFLQFLRLCLRMSLALSVRLYGFLFSRLAPVTEELLHVDITTNPCRMIACTVASVFFGAIVLLLFRSPRLAWIIILCLLHGLGVGLIWDELQHPDGIQMGTRIQ